MRSLRSIHLHVIMAICLLIAPSTGKSDTYASCVNDFNQQCGLYGTYSSYLGLGPFTVQSYNILYPGLISTILSCWSATGVKVDGYISCGIYLPQGQPTGPNQKVDVPQCENGSILNVDEQVLGESVPVTGTPFTLNYFSDRVPGRVGDYKIHVPITDSSGNPSDHQVATVTVTIAGRTFSQSFTTPGASTNYDFMWDGLDSTSATPATAMPAVVKLNITKTDSSVYPEIKYNFTLGNWKATSVGLGGWTISAHHYYDPANKIVYYGNGSNRNIEAELLSSGNYRLARQDGAEVYIFNSSGRHLETKHGLTGAVIYTFAYDGSGRLQSITDAYSNVTSVVRNGSGVLTGIQSPYGQVTDLTLDTNGYLATIENPNSETWQMTYYGTAGLLHTFQLPRGQTSTFTYNSNGMLTDDVSSAGNLWNLLVTGTASGYSTQNANLTSAEGKQSNLTMTINNGVYTRTSYSPDKGSTTYTYQAGQSESYTNSLYSQSVTSGPDVRFGLMTPIEASTNLTFYSIGTVASSVTQTVTYNNPSAPDPFDIASLTNFLTVNSKTTSAVYTGSTRVTEVTSPVGRKSYVTLNTQGRLASAQLSTYQPVQYTYDSHGRVSQITQGTRQTTFGYNSQGWLESVANPLSQTIQYGYDSAGRITTQTLPDLRTINYSYDANGNLISLTPSGRSAHGLAQNLFDLLQSYDPPALGSSTVSTTYTYDNDKNVTQITRPDGAVISLNYGAYEHRVATMTIPTETIYYAWDGLGQPLSVSSSSGYSFTADYLGPARPNQMAYAVPGGTTVGSMNFTYDANFRLASSKVTGTSSSNTISVSFTYDDDGLMTKAGSQTITWNTNSGLLTGTSLTRIAESYSYDSNYAELSAMTATYTPSGGSASTLFSESMTRDALGRIATKSETVSGTTTTYVYTYDSSGRLTDVTKNGASYSHYGYDSNSNRTSGNVGSTTITATYDGQDRLSTYNSKTYTYNLNGERQSRVDSSSSSTITSTYNATGDLTSVVIPGVGTVNYGLDPLGRRLQKKLGSTLKKTFLYESPLRISAELNSSGAIVSRFVYGTKSHVPDYMVKSGTTYKIITDHLGSVRLVVNASNGTISQRMDYDEFGVVTNDTSPGFQPFGFAGGLYDPDTKLVRFGARDYDAETGRWTSKDPIRFAGGDTNLFGYVANDPINNIDPDGLSYLVYHSGSNSLQVYSDDGKLLQTFNAYNSAQRSSNGPFPKGQFPFDRVSDHTGADASSNGRYGPNGNFIFNVPGRTNMGVHSGRAGSCDAANRCGSQYSTNGCIRTSDDATSFLRNLNGTDPIRFIRVEQ